MPLTPCYDCSRSISDLADACIHCGRPRPSAIRYPGRQSPAGPESIPFAPSVGGASPNSSIAVADGTDVTQSGHWKQHLAGLFGFLVMFAFFRLSPEGMAFRMLTGGIAGCLIGLLPYSQARKRDFNSFASRALVTCAVGGALAGLLLSVPLAIGLTLYVRTKSPPLMAPV
jgi:hypothetical protein